MIPRPTVTRGDRIILMGCIFSLIPIILILGFLLFVYTALNSCAHSGPLSVDSPSSDLPSALPSPAPPPLPPEPPLPPASPAPAVPSASEVPVIPEVPSLPPEPPPAEPPAEQPTAPEPPPPPAPHLRHIRWGMTPDEVRAAESPLAPLRATPNTLTYTTTTLDLPCHLTYTFRADRLAAARIQFSLPSSDDVPSLSPLTAHAAYLWLRSQLTARYDAPSAENHATRPRDTTRFADQARQSREDAEQYATSLASARQRLATRTAQLKEKYRNWPEAAARIDRELASERRYVADLESWVQDLENTERAAQAAIDQSRRDDTTSPLPARDTAAWQPDGSPHTVTLTADYTTTPSRLEIRYRTTLSLFDDI